jgi:hypothetical protein
MGIFGPRTVKGTNIKLTSEEEAELRKTSLFGQVPKEVSQHDYNKARERIAARNKARNKDRGFW